MKNLNNKGMTTLEVLLSFVIIVIITMSMYGTVSAFNEKRMIEEYKSQIYSYKNLLTKDIQDDFIKVGLTHAQYSEENTSEGRKYVLNCNLRDGTERILEITRQQGQSSYHISGDAGVSDYYMIKYGKPGDMVEYPLPDLGSYTPDGTTAEIKDLSINNVFIRIDDANVLTIHIGLYHPELLTRYAIDVVCPIDYVESGADSSSGLDLY